MDVVYYLIHSGGFQQLVPGKRADHIIEIGGQDVLRYAEMMTRYARVRGLKRLLIAVPVLTPRLSSY